MSAGSSCPSTLLTARMNRPKSPSCSFTIFRYLKEMPGHRRLPTSWSVNLPITSRTTGRARYIKREQVIIPPSTLGGWGNGSIKNWLEPVWEVMKQQLLESTYLQPDETPIPLSKDKPGSTHKGYLWVYHDPLKKLVVFDYRPSRRREGLDDCLKSFSGYCRQMDMWGMRN